ncbi:MAG: heavy metal sensor histidine kinase [Acidiferrobacteraceae bacterium]
MSSGQSRSWSIAWRLTSLYVLLSATLLIVAALFLYWLLQDSLRHQDNSAVAEEIHVLRVILRQRPHNHTVLQQEVRWEGGSSEAPPIYERVLTPSGDILIQTQGMARIAPPSVFPPPVRVGRHPPSVAELRTLGGGQTYRLMSAWAALGNSGRPQRLLQVALDVTHSEAMLSTYRTALVLVVLVGVLASVGASLVVVRRGMTPLSDITRAARRITATQLHERLPALRFPVELHPLAEAFNEMLDRLQESFTRLSQFSADLAHELRTPINNLMGEGEVALARPRTAHEYRQVLESSLEEYSRLSRMIDNLLFLARAENQAAPIDLLPLDLKTETAAVCEFHEAVAEEQGISIHYEGSGKVHADPILLRRALSNLLSNALRYTPRGGHVEMISSTSPAGAEILVRDNGLGIAAEHLPRLFDRFYRVDKTRSERSEGAGLGLSIVRSIMTLHNGTVTIRSSPGEGTEVRLHFPA